MSTSTSINTITSSTSTVDPNRAYTPAELAEAIGRSVHHVYELCREGLLRHSRTRPGARRGPITIAGAAWLEYQKRCEVGGDAGGDAGEDADHDDHDEHDNHPPVTRTRRSRRAREAATASDPWLEFESRMGKATG